MTVLHSPYCLYVWSHIIQQISVIIENRQGLLSHGSVRARKIALDIIDHTMNEIDAYRLTKKLVRSERDLLKVGSLTYDLSKIENIYVVGAGKAVFQIAEALEDILGDRIKKGVIIEKRLIGMATGRDRIKKLKRIKVFEGSHPVPDNIVVAGARAVLQIAESAEKRDLVFSCTTGGCTCLMTLPAEGISLEDVKKTTSLLLDSGANINQVCAVRDHISAINGGRLAKYIHPAEIINLIVNDGVWDFPEGWRSFQALGWGPSTPSLDSKYSTFEAAISVLKNYNLWDKTPSSVRDHLEKADLNAKVLNVKDFERIGIKYHSFVLADTESTPEAAKKRTKELGLNFMILSTILEGEAKDAGTLLASIAKEVVKNHRPVRPPCVIASSGETTVTITGIHGEGGRNQESVLSAALKIDGSKDVVIASVGTDGTDGPTSIAGGIVDGYTVNRAKEKKIDIFENLRRHDSSFVLRELGDTILFNQPGNNVCDFMLIVVTD